MVFSFAYSSQSIFLQVIVYLYPIYECTYSSLNAAKRKSCYFLKYNAFDIQ